MPKTPYLTAPIHTDKMPPGIKYIVGNEAAERFNFYGMRAILVVYMTKYLVDRTGALAPMSDNEASAAYHWFLFANYFFPMLGAIVADAFWGKYRTIFWISLVYCLGSVVLAIDHTRLGLTLGLTLIAIGSGGIKPCVSSNVGDQFGAANQHLLSKAFGWFYFSINFGSFFSILLIPVLLDKYGPFPAFGVPAVLMLLATFVFWLGRYKFAHIPPTGKPYLSKLFGRESMKAFGRFEMMTAFVLVLGVLWFELSDYLGVSGVRNAQGERSYTSIALLIASFVPVAIYAFSVLHQRLPRPELHQDAKDGWSILGRLAGIFVFIAIFWSLWDQSGGEWVLQAEKMNLRFLGINWLSSQIQAVNAVMVLAFIPLFQYVIYPLVDRVFPLTPLRKIGLGLIVAGLSFMVSAWIETQIAAGLKPSIGWQLPAYALLTAAEIMVSITGLEFAYTQAPRYLKSMVQALYLLSISAGNAFTALVHVFIENPDGTVMLHGASYYLFFSALSIGCVAIYVFVAKAYKERSYLQGEQPAPAT